MLGLILLCMLDTERKAKAAMATGAKSMVVFGIMNGVVDADLGQAVLVSLVQYGVPYPRNGIQDGGKDTGLQQNGPAGV